VLIACGALAATVAGLGILAGAALALRQAASASLSSDRTVRRWYDIASHPRGRDTAELPMVHDEP